MRDSNQIEQVIGQSVYGRDGDKLGKVGQVYLDDETGKPEWPPSRPACSGPRSHSSRSPRQTSPTTG